jgi:hypothetical protein
MNKITLITPPDFFDNDSLSLVFVNISEEEQDAATRWLSESTSDQPINIYFYQGEPNVDWLLFAVNRADGVYVNADGDSHITRWLASFLLSKHNTWYRTTDSNLKALLSYINQHSLDNITKFLEVHIG